MRVAVLGAGGTIAPAIVRDLAESAEVESLLLLDLDLDRAEHVASEHGVDKASAARADATAPADAPDSLFAALADCDVLVNSASYRVNLSAMDACLAADAHYLDLGGLYWMAGRQLERSPEFEAAGLLALLGIGSAPGKTNLLAAWAVEELTGDPAGADAGADDEGPSRRRGQDVSAGAEQPAGIGSIFVSAAGRDLDPPDGFSVPYALRTLVDELTMPPVVLRGGGSAEIEPMAPGGTVDFGEPIGPAETIYTLHSEMRTFADSFDCREGSFRLSLAPAVLERVKALAGSSEEEIERAAREAVPPSPRTVSVHLVEAQSDGRKARVRAVTEPMEDWAIGGGVVSTAAPAAAAVRLLARDRITARGALPPERCLNRREMFSELERRACRFEINVEEAARA
jgi:saccharopine dehydrogenase-like NADP-dependent oxidoreductase